jgi:hypothetical protein
MNTPLKRSLRRLGEAAEHDMPEIFVEFELALALKRFGVRKVLLRMLQMEVEDLKVQCLQAGELKGKRVSIGKS